MALTPEIQSLINTLHENMRDDAWQDRLESGYDAAIDALQTHDMQAVSATIREILRQNVDESILDDVLQAAEMQSAEEFAQAIRDRAQSWGPQDIHPRLQIDIDRNPRPLGARFANADPQNKNVAQRAAIDGHADTLLMAMMALQGMEGPAADGVGPTPAQQGIMPQGVNAGIHMSAQGQALFAYIDDVLSEGNRNIIYDPSNPPEDGQLRNSLTPAEMEGALRAAVMRDVENGTFPLSGLEAADADALVDIIKAHALDKIEGNYGIDYYGNTYVSYDPANNDLKAAINVVLSGDQAIVDLGARVVSNTETGQVYDADGYGDVYADIVSRGGHIKAADIIEHFKPLVEGYYVSDLPDSVNEQLNDARALTAEYVREDGTIVPAPAELQEQVKEAQELLAQYEGYEGQFIAPVINIPEARQAAFYTKIEEAFDIAARPNADGTFNRDPDAFGRVMAEDFWLVEQNGFYEVLRHDVYDYGAPVHVKLAVPEEAGAPVEAHGSDNQLMFRFPDFAGGESFSIYGVRGPGDATRFEEISTDVNTAEELRAFFGDEFDVRVVGEPDFDMDGSNTNPVGYFIEGGNGNSFYVGFDAISENGVSDAFRQARSQQVDTTSRNAVPGNEYTVGHDDSRPSVDQFNL